MYCLQIVFLLPERLHGHERRAIYIKLLNLPSSFHPTYHLSSTSTRAYPPTVFRSTDMR